jgi:hypothetical protein
LAKKPVIYLLNADPKEVSQELLGKIKNLGEAVVNANLKDELEMHSLSDEERKEFGFVAHFPYHQTTAYEILNLITFFTTGSDETRAWTIRKGSTAPQAGGAIHSDFEKNFIKAEVIQWEKLLEAGSWSEAAGKGWLRQEGKEYIVQDGDVIEIKHG